MCVQEIKEHRESGLNVREGDSVDERNGQSHVLRLVRVKRGYSCEFIMAL